MMTKFQALQQALRNGSAWVFVNGRVEGVRIPPPHDSVILNLARNVPGSNMDVSSHGFEVTLRFNGQPFRCVIPWKAVWRILVKEGPSSLWGEDMPKEDARCWVISDDVSPLQLITSDCPVVPTEHHAPRLQLLP